MTDLSHGNYKLQDRAGLIDLPHSYVELYAAVKSHSIVVQNPDYDPVVCLICGAVVLAGYRSGRRRVGDCTLHASECGGGTGVFLMVQKCCALLVRDTRAAYYPSLYLDQHGEEDTGLRRGRPLYLNDQRYDDLQSLYLRHRIVQEVTMRRSSADRVIRDSFY